MGQGACGNGSSGASFSARCVSGECACATGVVWWISATKALKIPVENCYQNLEILFRHHSVALSKRVR